MLNRILGKKQSSNSNPESGLVHLQLTKNQNK